MADILIIYEHKARDYQYCHLIKYEMKRRGYSASVCHQSHRNLWWHRIFSKPRVVVRGAALETKMINGSRFIDYYSDYLRGRVPFYVNLQAEQIFRDEEGGYNIIKSDEYQESVYYICWGEKRKQQLLQNGVDEAKIALTGPIQMDFLRPEFHSMYANKRVLARENRLDPKKRWILIISNYLYASLSNDIFQWSIKAQKDVGIRNTLDDFLESKELSVVAQRITLTWLSKYLEKADVEVIYRPHPTELNTESVKKLLSSHPKKFHVIPSDSVQQWIIASDSIQTWGSTAIIEAYYAKKHCSIVQPTPRNKMMTPLVFEGCSYIDRYDDFVSSQEDIAFDEESFPIDKEKIDLFYKKKEKCSYIELCDFIEQVYQKETPRNGVSSFAKKDILSKKFLAEIYRSIYAVTRIKWSWVIPIKRNSFRKIEKIMDNDRQRDNYFISWKEKRTCKRIKKIVYSIAKTNR